MLARSRIAKLSIAWRSQGQGPLGLRRAAEEITPHAWTRVHTTLPEHISRGIHITRLQQIQH